MLVLQSQIHSGAQTAPPSRSQRAPPADLSEQVWACWKTNELATASSFLAPVKKISTMIPIYNFSPGVFIQTQLSYATVALCLSLDFDYHFWIKSEMCAGLSHSYCSCQVFESRHFHIYMNDFWHAFKVEDLFYKPIFPLCHGRPQHLSAWAPRERIWANQGTLTFILKGISVRLTSSSLLVRNHLHQDKLWFFSFSKQPMARRSAILIIPTSELRWAFHGLMVWWYFLLVRACPIHFWFISDPFLITLIGFDSWIASHLHLALQILSV